MVCIVNATLMHRWLLHDGCARNATLINEGGHVSLLFYM
jgi:hypothetical protein